MFLSIEFTDTSSRRTEEWTAIQKPWIEAPWLFLNVVEVNSVDSPRLRDTISGLFSP